jgi:hypothetical protein
MIIPPTLPSPAPGGGLGWGNVTATFALFISGYVQVAAA